MMNNEVGLCDGVQEPEETLFWECSQLALRQIQHLLP